jgi:hypothetical protein
MWLRQTLTPAGFVYSSWERFDPEERNHPLERWCIDALLSGHWPVKSLTKVHQPHTIPSFREMVGVSALNTEPKLPNEQYVGMQVGMRRTCTRVTERCELAAQNVMLEQKEGLCLVSRHLRRHDRITVVISSF